MVARKGETLGPTWQTSIHFQRHPQTPTHQMCAHQTQIQCQAFPWTPLLPQCPLPVQLKLMGCTFFWNSQEKWSGLICLRLLPTKQIIHSQNIQMLWRVYLLYCPLSQHGILDSPSWQTSAMPVHGHLTLQKVLLSPSSNGIILFTRHLPRENIRIIHWHDLHHCLSRWHTCTYLRFLQWSPMTTQKCF